MNTKQKLTLGIAAIFMVTLTIVGVTYAYFVTRVTGDTTESVNVQTASLASVEYGDGNNIIELKDILPGTTTYKTFTVTNKGDEGAADASYDIFLTSKAGSVEFVHANDDSECYKAEAKPSNDVNGKTESCFDGPDYNNIKVTLYSYTDAALTGEVSETTFNNLTKTQVYGENKLAKTSDTTVQVLGQGLLIPAATTYNYILKVEYANNNQNQNIENLANVSIKVDIR